jgi:2-polyprenyl-3-methyl-5-hydroxy-6-metoxy-1,4-benzoquinol methylase
MKVKYNFNYESGFKEKDKNVSLIELLNVKINFLFKILKIKINNFINFKSTVRSTEKVKNEYNFLWQNINLFPKFPSNKRHYFYYKGNYFRKEIFTERKVFFEIIKSSIAIKQPKSILEVGCGNGIIINTLARLYRNIKFTGIDLTKNGINISRSLKNNNNYYEKIGNYFEDFNFKKLVNNLNFNNISILKIPDKKNMILHSLL